MDDTGICEHCGKLIKFVVKTDDSGWWVTESRGKRGQIKQERFCKTTPEFPVRVHGPVVVSPNADTMINADADSPDAIDDERDQETPDWHSERDHPDFKAEYGHG